MGTTPSPEQLPCALRPSDSTTSLGIDTKTPPDPISVDFPRAAAEGWVRLWSLAAPQGQTHSTGHHMPWKLSPTVALSFQRDENVTWKAAQPWLCYASGCTGLFPIQYLQGYFLDAQQQAVNISPYSLSRQLLPGTRTHDATNLQQLIRRHHPLLPLLMALQNLLL